MSRNSPTGARPPMQVLNQEYLLESVDAVRPHPENINQGDVGAIFESIEDNGFFGACVVQRSTGYICIGNHRYKAALEHGATHVPVLYVDVDDDRALRMLLADNRLAELAYRDPKELVELLGGLVSTTGTLSGTGYSTDDLDELIRGLQGDAPEIQGDAPEAPKAICPSCGCRFDPKNPFA